MSIDTLKHVSFSGISLDVSHGRDLREGAQTLNISLQMWLRCIELYVHQNPTFGGLI